MMFSRGLISLIIGLLVCSSLTTSSEAGRRIPAARDIMPNGIPTAEEATLTGLLGCCSAAAFLDQHPQPQQSDTVKKPSRMMAITEPQKTVDISTSSVATTAAPGGLSSGVTITRTETPHRPRRSTDILATTSVATTMLWEKKIQPVQAIVAVITAFVTAIVLSGMTFFVLACSASGSLLLGRSEADSRMTSDVEKADGYPSFANSQEHCHVSMVYYTIDPRDSSGGGGGPARMSKAVLTAAPGGPIESRTEAEVFGAAAALAEKSRLLLACQGELEALKTKLADAEATLEASSSEAISLRSTLAETQLDLQQTKKTSERRLAQMEEKDAQLSRLEFEAEILNLENRRQEEELLDAQEDLSSLSNELFELSDGDDEINLHLLSSAAGL